MLVGGVNPPARVTLSPSEAEYVAGGVAHNLRADGRGTRDWRAVTAEIDPVPQASGSARLRLGGTDVLVSIKGDIAAPALDTPAEGAVVCAVDSASVFSMNVAVGGASEERLAAERNAELTAVLTDVLVRSGAIDRTLLSIVPGKHCWVLYIDVLVLDYDGNLVDATVMAARLALAATRLPLVRIEEGGEATEIVLADEHDPHRTIPAARIPIAITLALVGAGAGAGFVVDPSAPEEVCAHAALVVAVRTDGSIAMIRKLGAGTIDPGLIPEYIDAAREAAAHLDALCRK